MALDDAKSASAMALFGRNMTTRYGSRVVISRPSCVACQAVGDIRAVQDHRGDRNRVRCAAHRAVTGERARSSGSEADETVCTVWAA